MLVSGRVFWFWMKGPLVIDLLTFYWHPGLSFTVNTTSAYVDHKAKQQDEDSQMFSEWHRLSAEKMATVSRVRSFFFFSDDDRWHFLRFASGTGRLFHQKSVPACCWSTVTMFVAGDMGAALSLGYLKHVFFLLNSVGAHLHFWSFFSSIWWHFPEPAKCDFGRCTAWRGTYDTSAHHPPKMITIRLWWGVQFNIYSIKTQFGGENCHPFLRRGKSETVKPMLRVLLTVGLRSKVHICSDIFCPTKVTEVQKPPYHEHKQFWSIYQASPYLHTITPYETRQRIWSFEFHWTSMFFL